MSDLKELEKRMAARDARRAELAGQLEEQEARVQRARDAFVDGAADRELMQAQLRRRAVKEALEGLDGELEGLRADLEETRATEERERSIARLVELAAEGVSALAAWNKARREANEALREHAGRLLEERGRLVAARKEFVSLATELAPGVRSLPIGRISPERAKPLEAEVERLRRELEGRGADLSVVCSEGIDRSRTALDRGPGVGRFVEKVEPFGGLLPRAMEDLARERHLDARRAQEAEIQGAVAG